MNNSIEKLPSLDIDGLVREIAGLAGQYDVFRFLKRFTADIGCRGFYIARIPSMTSRGMADNSILTNWPTELIQRYDANGMMRASPIITRLQSSSVPFHYDVEELYKGKGDARSLAALEMFRSAGLVRGAVFPVSDVLGERAFIIFAGDQLSCTTGLMTLVHFIATHIYDRLYQIRQLDRRGMEALTEREVDCLTWTAAGKTSSEIAEILTLSEHTVNHYLNRAARKLDTVNRTQAVAKALRSGIIR